MRCAFNMHRISFNVHHSVHVDGPIVTVILHVNITICGVIVCVSTTNSHTCIVILITVCTKGYAIGWVCVYIFVYMYSSQNIGCVVSCWSKNVQESTCAAFILHIDVVNVMVNCRFTPNRALFLFLCNALKVVGFGGTKIRCVMKCSYSLVLMQRLSLCWLLRLDSACSAECQQLQCSIAAHVVLYKCMLRAWNSRTMWHTESWSLPGPHHKQITAVQQDMSILPVWPSLGWSCYLFFFMYTITITTWLAQPQHCSIFGSKADSSMVAWLTQYLLDGGPVECCVAE